MVLGQGEDNSVNNNWCVFPMKQGHLGACCARVLSPGFASRFITGAVHVVVDRADPPVRTTGRILDQRLPPTPLTIAAGFPSADHKALNVTVGTGRSWYIRSEIETGAGGKRLVSVSMQSEYSNAQELKDGGLYQVRLGILMHFASLHVAPIILPPRDGITDDSRRCPLSASYAEHRLQVQVDTRRRHSPF